MDKPRLREITGGLLDRFNVIMRRPDTLEFLDEDDLEELALFGGRFTVSFDLSAAAATELRRRRGPLGGLVSLKKALGQDN